MRVAAYGDVSIDVVLEVPDLPAPGGEVFSSLRLELLGGSAVNTAVVLTRLGLDSVVMGAVGEDEAGYRALHLLASEGVDTAQMSVSRAHPTAMNTVLVTPDGERTMIGARGANAHYTAMPGWDEGVDWLHVSGYALMEGSQQGSALEAMDTAAEKSIPCSLDVPVGVGERIRGLVADRLSGLRVVTGSRRALAELTDGGDPIENLAVGSVQVAVTSGSEPLLLARGREMVSLTPPLVDAVDVTGAGDAFAAGLIAGAVSGLEVGPAAVLAAATGAAATLLSGASGTLADGDVWSDLLDEWRWTDADPSWLTQARSWVEETGESTA